MKRVDLNADLGESFGAYTVGMDEALIPLVTSVNVACGFHAGDPMVMRDTVRLAKRFGTAVGAHPGLPDLQGFGRRRMDLTPDEARAMVMYQVGALQAFLRAEGMALQHVKLHGALYNAAAVDMRLSLAICEGIRSMAPDAVFMGLAGSRMLEAALEAGLRTASEVFADRAYNDDGTLVSRREPGAVLTDPDEIAARALRMVRDGVVESIHGVPVSITADTICLHGDNQSALNVAGRIRQALGDAGVVVSALR